MQVQFLNDRLAPTVESQPSVELHHWRILKRGNGGLHLAAQMDSGSLRVTSKLQCMELSRGVIRTDSGRSYQLCAQPEDDEVLHAIIQLNALISLHMISEDVSQVIWDAINAGAWPVGGTPLLLPPQ